METACVFVVPRGMHPSTSTPLLVPGVVSKPPGWPLECASGGDEGEDVERAPAAAALPAGQLPVSRAAVSPASVAPLAHVVALAQGRALEGAGLLTGGAHHAVHAALAGKL